MSQPVIVSSVPCRCCLSARNSMNVHGQCDHTGKIIAQMYQVVCVGCKSSGPTCETPEKALQGWEMLMLDKPEQLIKTTTYELLQKVAQKTG